MLTMLTRSAGRPVFWAIIRSESEAAYCKVLQTMKARCTEIRREEGLPDEWQPSTMLVDNSDAEIGACRCSTAVRWSDALQVIVLTQLSWNAACTLGFAHGADLLLCLQRIQSKRNVLPSLTWGFECRKVLNVDPYLCTWHATKAWLEQCRNKLVDKDRFQEAFDALHDVMVMKLVGTREERLQQVDDALKKVQEQFAGETEWLKWLNRAWVPKSSMLHQAIVAFACSGVRQLGP